MFDNWLAAADDSLPVASVCPVEEKRMRSRSTPVGRGSQTSLADARLMPRPAPFQGLGLDDMRNGVHDLTAFYRAN